jgi:hypothetical protein
MPTLVFFMILLAAQSQPAAPPIGIIDIYGARTLTHAQIRQQLQIKEGDPAPLQQKDFEQRVMPAYGRLLSLPNVAQVDINFVCCSDDGRTILFVGVQEKGTPAIQFLPAPTGSVRLPQEYIEDDAAFFRALQAAIAKGAASEDDSGGYALNADPESRAIQLRYVDLAERDKELLRDVLHHSSDPQHRAIAAQVLGYAAPKQSVIPDLVEAMRDSFPTVRNNAMRALAVIAKFAQQSPQLGLTIPREPFIAMLNSVAWTDLNKSAFALFELTGNHDSEFLLQLRQKAVPALLDMARWKSTGHAHDAFFLLGRIEGMPEEEIQKAWDKGDRQTIITKALNPINASTK